MALTMEQFNKLNGLQPDYLDGTDPEKAKHYLDSYIFNSEKPPVRTFDGLILNFDELYNRFDNYVKWWQITYKNRDKQYIKKTEQIAHIMKFVSTKMYNNKYEVKKDDRDKYLFGDFSDEYIRKRVKEFKDKIGKKDEQEDYDLPF